MFSRQINTNAKAVTRRRLEMTKLCLAMLLIVEPTVIYLNGQVMNVCAVSMIGQPLNNGWNAFGYNQFDSVVAFEFIVSIRLLSNNCMDFLIETANGCCPLRTASFCAFSAIEMASLYRPA